MIATNLINKMTSRINKYVGSFISSLKPEAARVPVADWYRMNLAGTAQGESWFRLTHSPGKVRTMKERLILVMALTVAIAATAACTSEAPRPTATFAPTATASPTATPVPEPDIDALTQENFRALLSVEVVEGVLIAEVPLNTEFIDYKENAASVDPAQVADMDSWYGLSIQTEDGTSGITFSVIDFDSQSSAQDHFEVVKAGTPGLEIMESPIGDESTEVEVNSQGIGAMILFVQGDKVVSVHTTQPDDERPLVDLKGLEQLAEIVQQKLE